MTTLWRWGKKKRPFRVSTTLPTWPSTYQFSWKVMTKASLLLHTIQSSMQKNKAHWYPASLYPRQKLLKEKSNFFSLILIPTDKIIANGLTKLLINAKCHRFHQALGHELRKAKAAIRSKTYRGISQQSLNAKVVIYQPSHEMRAQPGSKRLKNARAIPLPAKVNSHGIARGGVLDNKLFHSSYITSHDSYTRPIMASSL